MDKIESFKVNHLILKSGLYVSRKDTKNGVTVTTFDLRVTAPNAEPPMDVPAIHTIEHLGATYLRNSIFKDDVVYFGPMGCRTGFYLLLFGDRKSEEIYSLVCDLCEFIIDFDGEIPGATAKECGNYLDQNLPNAKFYAKKYLNELRNKRFYYPEETIKGGCVLFDPETKKIALVYRAKLNDYSFPKGHLEKGETIEECAVRETAEETKRVAVILKRVPPFVLRYVTPSGENCVSYMYLAIDAGKSDNDSPDTHPTYWFPIDEVKNKLSYDNNKDIFDKVLPFIQDYENYLG